MRFTANQSTCHEDDNHWANIYEEKIVQHYWWFFSRLCSFTDDCPLNGYPASCLKSGYTKKTNRQTITYITLPVDYLELFFNRVVHVSVFFRLLDTEFVILVPRLMLHETLQRQTRLRSKGVGAEDRLCKESSRIVDVIISVHRVLFSVTPSLPTPKIVLWKCSFLTKKWNENATHHNRHLKKAYGGLDRPAYSVYACKNDYNSGWLLKWSTNEVVRSKINRKMYSLSSL